MKTKAAKTAELAFLKTTFEENPILLICQFQGIKVADDFKLRSTVRQAAAGYRVVPNRLARLASEGTPFGPALEKTRGMTSLVWAKDDPVPLLKILLEYSRTNPVFEFKAGVVEGQELDAEGLKQLSKMPSKEEVLAKLLYVMNEPARRLLAQINAPAQNLIGVVNAPARDQVSVLKQAVDQKKFTN